MMRLALYVFILASLPLAASANDRVDFGKAKPDDERAFGSLLKDITEDFAQKPKQSESALKQRVIRTEERRKQQKTIQRERNTRSEERTRQGPSTTRTPPPPRTR